MSTTTTNFGLIKLELSDPADITAINENWDNLDELLHGKFEEFNSTLGEVGSMLDEINGTVI